MIKTLDDPAAFLKFADADISFRMKALQLELYKLQTMKNLIATLPLPLP